jgi:hypothetical protein
MEMHSWLAHLRAGRDGDSVAPAPLVLVTGGERAGTGCSKARGVLVAAEGVGLSTTEPKNTGLGGTDPGPSLEDTEMTSGDEEETEGRSERVSSPSVSWSLPVLVGHEGGGCSDWTELAASSLVGTLDSEYTGETGE